MKGYVVSWRSGATNPFHGTRTTHTKMPVHRWLPDMHRFRSSNFEHYVEDTHSSRFRQNLWKQKRLQAEKCHSKHVPFLRVQSVGCALHNHYHSENVFYFTCIILSCTFHLRITDLIDETSILSPEIEHLTCGICHCLLLREARMKTWCAS